MSAGAGAGIDGAVATRQGEGAGCLYVGRGAWIHGCSPLARTRRVGATRPPPGIIGSRSMGSRPHGVGRSLQREGTRCPWRTPSKPCRRSAIPPQDACSEGDLPACARASAPSARGSRPMLPLPPDAARRRGRPPLRRAARLRALPPPAARGARPDGGRALARAPAGREGPAARGLKRAAAPRVSFAPPWTPSPAPSRSAARARRSSTTSPTSPTTRSSATTTSSTGA